MKKEFFIESPHTKEECLKAMDETLAMGDHMLEMYKWACSSDDHRAFAFVMANNKDEAKKMVPDIVRQKASITEIMPLTKEEIMSYHK